MDEQAMDQHLTYQDIEPMIEAAVNEPVPDGLIEQFTLDLPEAIDQEWLALPEIDQEWLALPEIDQEWLQAIEPGEPNLSHESPEAEKIQDDLEH